jgi:hypothetical protein
MRPPIALPNRTKDAKLAHLGQNAKDVAPQGKIYGMICVSGFSTEFIIGDNGR